MSMHIYFRPTSLYNTLTMLVLMAGGLGLIARSLKAAGPTAGCGRPRGPSPRRQSGATAMKKIYVIDTNVLVHDPEALLRFEDNEIVLPIAVIEELDGLKRGQGEIPASVRQALRLIDSFREQGNLSRGVPLPGGAACGSRPPATPPPGSGFRPTTASS